MSRNDNASAIVVFDVCGHPYALQTTHVREVMTWRQPRPLPGAHMCIEGVINLRGEVIPVCDLGQSIGLGRRGTPTVDTAIVVCEIDDECVGFVVDEVRAVMPMAQVERVDGGQHQQHPAIDSIVQSADGELIVLLRPIRELASGLQGLAQLLDSLEANTEEQHHDAAEAA